jgi:[ribosomal protein S5]-alanine N-acetyltransferase
MADEDANVDTLHFLLDAGCCQIRPFQSGDRESLVRHANNWRVARNMRDLFPHPYTLVEADAWLTVALQQNPVTKFAIAVDGEAVGGIGLTLQDDVYRRSAEIGYWLGESFWGRGIVTAAVRTVTRFAFDTFDLTRIFANVFAWNPASGRVLEKAGYLREGVLRQSVFKEGQMIDAFLYAITRDQFGTQGQSCDHTKSTKS